MPAALFALVLEIESHFLPGLAWDPTNLSLPRGIG
jgi:hypothetical protein